MTSSDKKRKTKRRAVRDPLFGKVMYYTNTKTVGLRNPFTGKIEKRISKEKASKRGFLARTYTLWDDIESKKRKKKSFFDI